MKSSAAQQPIIFSWRSFYTAETESHEGKRKVESLWPIFRIHHQRSRYIYDLFYRRKAISRGKLCGLCLLLISDASLIWSS